jgi:hypothetical protein
MPHFSLPLREVEFTTIEHDKTWKSGASAQRKKAA